MTFRISQPSVQSLYVEMHANGYRIACGTAFVGASATGKPFLLTARHNVTGRHQETGELLSNSTGAVPDTLVVWHNSSRELGEFVKVSVPLLCNDHPQWMEHPILGGAADFVALSVNPIPELSLYPYTLDYDAHTQIEPAQTVSVVGFPFGERTTHSFAVWATGFVASEPDINHGGRPVFLIDCRSRQGQSGSPVIRYQNGGGVLLHENGARVNGPFSRALGLYSGRIRDDSDLGIVWKAYALAELLDHASVSAIAL